MIAVSLNVGDGGGGGGGGGRRPYQTGKIVHVHAKLNTH